MSLKIGLGHESGHGKDTAAKLLITHLRTMVPGLRVRKVSFADKLKLVVHDLYGWTGIHPPIHYENNRADRELIIPALGINIVTLWVQVGEALRAVDPKIWINYWSESGHDADVVIAPDVRNELEVEACHVVYKVHNPRIPPREGLSIDHHLKDFTAWNGILLNDGDLKKLNKLMEGVANSLIVNHDLHNKSS